MLTLLDFSRTRTLFFHLASVVDTKLPVCVLSKKHSSLCTLLKKILVENIEADGTLTEFKDSNNVCVVTFENVEGLAPLIAKNCRHLVCLNQNLTAKQKDALSKQSLLKTTILNLNEIFSPKCLRNTLNTAAEWIRKNADIVQTLFDVCASEPKLQTIPVKEIRLLKDDGLFLLPIRRTLEAMFDKNGVYIVTWRIDRLGVGISFATS
ncbi:hypothetical protein DPMN_068013 [Dreissena polymorpha]|uniref:Uncharacterized protein n=1 Tax=Dreissena polymorpha TaxID=45954 RepID=A0A9D4BTV9_DREPO|nr:hypothetical protein DPMN_068013 [Dreissena polymorpha]